MTHFKSCELFAGGNRASSLTLRMTEEVTVILNKVKDLKMSHYRLKSCLDSKPYRVISSRCFLTMRDTVYGWRAASLKRLGLLAFFASISLGFDVEAACRQVCTQQTSCESLTGEDRWKCVASRAGETTSCRTVCTDSHGAIAHSRQNGSWGQSFDYESQGRANRIALAYCKRHASDCRVAVNFTNQCGAIAESKQGDASPGVGATKREAESRSLAACRASKGKTCKVVTSACSVD